jgi:hypothetical protein
MLRKLSDKDFHARYCPVRNARVGLFLVVYFSVVAFVGWKGLHKAPEQPGYLEFLLAIFLVAMFWKWLVAFTCFRERLVLILVIVSLVTGEVTRLVPSVFSKHAELIKSGKLVLSLLGLLVSLTMLIQSKLGDIRKAPLSISEN